MKLLGDLPNIDGYEFKGVTHDNREVPCVVRKGKDGTHRAFETSPNMEIPIFQQLAGWRRILP